MLLETGFSFLFLSFSFLFLFFFYCWNLRSSIIYESISHSTHSVIALFFPFRWANPTTSPTSCAPSSTRERMTATLTPSTEQRYDHYDGNYLIILTSLFPFSLTIFNCYVLATTYALFRLNLPNYVSVLFSFLHPVPLTFSLYRRVRLARC